VSHYILAIDQGTTSSRAMVVDEQLTVIASSQREFTQHYPQSGWVEHDADEIWQSVLDSVRDVLKVSGVPVHAIAGIGIANQRETTVVWDRATGKPICPAIVWQDRRTAAMCEELRAAGHEPLVQSQTGLLLDPYFSATKLAWVLGNCPGARSAADSGRLAFGTIDTFLLWRLTGGQAHATDATNASRTMLYDIHANAWSDDLLRMFGIPASVLPVVMDSAALFGRADSALFGAAIPIVGMVGDQQAAAIGQGCFEAGMLKATYGTGCFALMNTGNVAVQSQSRLLTTIAYRLRGKTSYALEGSIFVAGAAVQWLRDGLGIIAEAAESGPLAASADPHQDVVLVPAFVGMGAPYWDSECRGALFGLTRATGPRELACAALESVCYQTRDLVEAMLADRGSGAVQALRVDGGMVASDWTMQRLADILNVAVDRPTNPETTALGAAYLAGLEIGLYPEPAEFAKVWALERRFQPEMPDAERERKYAGWKNAVRRTLSTG
jgi:glycerol kinase